MKVVKLDPPARLDPPAIAAAFVAGLLVLFGGFGIASASVNLQDFEFTVNDKFSDEIDAGDDVDVGFSFDVNDGDEVEFARVRFINSNGDIVESTCRGIGRISDADDREVEVNVDTKSDITEGTLDVEVALFGKPGVEQANNCNSDDLLDDETYENRLFVQEGTGDSNEDNDDDNSSGSGSNDDDDAGANSFLKGLEAQIKALVAVVAKLVTPPTPPASTGNKAKCDAIAAYRGAPAGTYSAAGVQLQSALLLDNPYSIPALKPGASIPMGYRGPQTEAALAAYLAMYQCL